MSADRIARMANDIAKFMESKPHDQGVKELSSHINDFWEPRMRRQLFERIDAGGAELRPLVMDAKGLIRRPAAEQAA